MTDKKVAEIGKAISHPLRVAMIREFRKGGPISPNGLSKRLGEPLGNASYHCNALRDAGVLRLTSTEPRRGAIEHFYELGGQNKKQLLAALDALG